MKQQMVVWSGVVALAALAGPGRLAGQMVLTTDA